MGTGQEESAAEMDNSVSAGGPRGSRHPEGSLETIFQHPEGLATARDLVQAVASNWFSGTTRDTQNTVQSTETSPEVEGILRDILAFSSLHDSPDLGATMAGESGQHVDVMDWNTLEETDNGEFCRTTSGVHAGVHVLSRATATLSATFNFANDAREQVEAPSQRGPSYPATSYPSSKKLPSQFASLQRGYSDASPENEIRSIFSAKIMTSTSLLPGTESPYRVESPAVQASNVTSKRSFAHGNRDSTSTSDTSIPTDSTTYDPCFSSSIFQDDASRKAQMNRGTGKARIPSHFVDRTLSNESDYATKPANPSNDGRKDHGLNNYFTPTNTSSPCSVAYAGLPPVSVNINRRESPTIKSFLPVNKQFVHNTTVSDNRKSSAQSHAQRLINTPPRNLDSFRISSQERFISSLQSPSPPPSFATPQRRSSPTLNDLSSPGLTDSEGESESEASNMSSQRKRKADTDGSILKGKRQKPESGSMQLIKRAARKAAKQKEPKPEQVSRNLPVYIMPLTDFLKAKEKLPQAIWMRILEFTPPHFLTRARLINKSFKGMVDQFDSIFINCRKENFGWDMPPPPNGLTERQYSDLFGGKGCLEPGCTDELSSRTHWSWAKRWCQDCWKSKIEREDRAIKKYQNRYVRPTLTKLFECIPVGVHDSFMKPHDYIDNIETRERQAPRLYKYYLTEDVQNVIAEYEALAPAPFVENPNDTPEQKAWARSEHQKLVDALEEKQNEFFATRKKINDEHMARVQKIETAVRDKRNDNRKPNTANRDARKALFMRRAEEDLPQIPATFVKSTKAFKAATRIFRDAGTERGWQTLKPKIQKEWEDSSATEKSTSPAIRCDGSPDSDGEDQNISARVSLGRPHGLAMHQPLNGSYPSHDLYGLASSSAPDLGASSIMYRSNPGTHQQNFAGMYSSNASNRNMHSAYLAAAAYPVPQPSYHNNASGNAYGHHGSQYQHMMGSSSLVGNAYSNHRQPVHHDSNQAPRPMSIPSLLQDPSQPMRYSHPSLDPRSYLG